jgi:hypothetical protein
MVEAIESLQIRLNCCSGARLKYGFEGKPLPITNAQIFKQTKPNSTSFPYSRIHALIEEKILLNCPF